MAPITIDLKPPPPQREHFSTEHLLGDLKGRTVRGGAVTLLAQGGKLVVSLGSTMVLARLLEPRHFGVFAMVMAFVGIIGLFKDLGLSLATVQKPDLSAAHVSTLFWVNVAASIALVLIAALAAPLVAVFYKSAELIGVTIALSLPILLGGLATQHHALLRRQMRYGRLALIDVGSLFAGAFAGVVLAAFGAGVWALVWMQIVTALVTLVGSWQLCPWRPGRPGTFRDVRDLLGFGADVTGFSLLGYLSRNLDKALLGRFFGEAAVGLYHNAYKLMMMPLALVNAPLSSVAVPALSPIADDGPRYREAFLRIVDKLGLLTLPGLAVMITTSDWLVRIVLGPQWEEAAVIFAVLGVAGLVQPLGSAVGWLLVSQGRTRDHLRWSTLDFGLTAVAFLGGLAWGPVGVAAGFAFINIVVRFPMLFWVAGRRGPVATRDLYVATAPGAACALTTLATILLWRHHAAPSHPFGGLCMALLLGVGASVVTLVLIPGGRRLLRDAWGVFRVLRPRR